jgi:predicted RNA binding protein YcfA (HicA-like mRNA interferase family)
VRVDSRHVLKLLRADGWKPKNQVGSHLQLEHDVKPGKVTLPHPKKDIPLGTLRNIERQSGLNLRKR